MPRNYESTAKFLKPDPIYGSILATKVINKIMQQGKRTLAQRIFYKAVEAASKRIGLPEEERSKLFEVAVENVKPTVEVRSKRVGGANYQVPVEVRPARRAALAMRWLRESARKRSEKSMGQRLAAEMMEAAESRGGAVKKRDEVHRMAEANKAFAHFRF